MSGGIKNPIRYKGNKKMYDLYECLFSLEEVGEVISGNWQPHTYTQQ